MSYISKKLNHKQRIEHGQKMLADAGKDVVTVAAAMFIIMPQETDYLFSGSYDDYVELYAPYQMQANKFICNWTASSTLWIMLLSVSDDNVVDYVDDETGFPVTTDEDNGLLDGAEGMVIVSSIDELRLFKLSEVAKLTVN